jgi:hypothetical protein
MKQVNMLPPREQANREAWSWPWPCNPLPPTDINYFRLVYYYHKSNLITQYLDQSLPLREDLLVNEGPKSKIGYGLLLVDSWSGAKQAWSLTLLSFTISLVFGAILSVRGLLRWIPAFSHIVEHSNVTSMEIIMVDLGFTLFLSSLILLVLTSLGYTNIVLVSSQFPRVRRIINHVTFYLSSGSRNATRSGDSQPGLQTAKRAEWINVSRITSIKVLDD